MRPPAVRVLVTRPAAQAADWVERLRGLGLDAEALPLIGIEPVADAGPLRDAWRTLSARRLVMFVSPNAVEQFFDQRPPDACWPERTIAASPGPSTTRSLLAQGVPRESVVAPADDAPQFDSEALWAVLRPMAWREQKTLFVRGETGRDWLADRLREAGAQVQQMAAYRRALPVLDAAARRRLDAALHDPARHLWWFSSSEAIDNLERLVPGAGWAAARALATHPRIAERARRLGFGQVDAVRPDTDEIVAAMRRSIQSRAP